MIVSDASGNSPIGLRAESLIGRPSTVDLSTIIPSGAATLLMGDSITQRAGECNGKAWAINGAAEFSSAPVTGPFTYLNALCGHPFNVIRNGGVAGERSDQILARFDSEYARALAKAGRVDVVSIMAGTNDLGITGFDASVTYNNVTALVNKAVAKHAFVLLWLIPPKGSLSISAVAHKQQTNARLRAFAAKTANVICIDTEAETCNQTGVDGSWASGYVIEAGQVHPDTYTALYLMTRGAVAQIQSVFRPYQLISAHSDSFDGSGSPAIGSGFGDGQNLLTRVQSFATASGGTATPLSSAIISGTPASGWTLQASGAGLTVTCSQPARSDGIGNNQTFSAAVASGSGQWWELSYQTNSRYIAGKWYEFALELSIDSGHQYIKNLYAFARAATGSLAYVRDLDYSNIGAGTAQATSPLKLTVVTPRIPYQGTDQMRVGVWCDLSGAVGTGVVSIGRISLREWSSQI